MNVLTPLQTKNLKAWGKISPIQLKELKPLPLFDVLIVKRTDINQKQTTGIRFINFV